MTKNKHTKDELIQLQALPLEAKIVRSKRIIREWYEHFDANVHVNFSGGKDSTVVKHLVDSIYSDVPSVFVNTGLEYPEIQKFVRDCKDGKYTKDGLNNNVLIIRPEKMFKDVIHDYGFPVIGKRQAEAIELGRANIKNGKYTLRCRMLGITKDEAAAMGMALPDASMVDRYENTVNGSVFSYSKYRYLLEAPFKISAKCCDVLKKKPNFLYQKKTGSSPYLGTLANESASRKNAWLKNGCNAFNASHRSSQPISFWTENDVLEYLVKYKVPYCSIYGDVVMNNDGTYTLTGVKRTGCMFCMFGVQNDAEPNRFQQMKLTHPKQYDYCINTLGLKEVLSYINVPYE